MSDMHKHSMGPGGKCPSAATWCVSTVVPWRLCGVVGCAVCEANGGPGHPEHDVCDGCVKGIPCAEHGPPEGAEVRCKCGAVWHVGYGMGPVDGVEAEDWVAHGGCDACDPHATGGAS